MPIEYLKIGTVQSDGVYGSPRKNALTINDNFKDIDDRLKALEAAGPSATNGFTLQDGQPFTPQG